MKVKVHKSLRNAKVFVFQPLPTGLPQEAGVLVLENVTSKVITKLRRSSQRTLHAFLIGSLARWLPYSHPAPQDLVESIIGASLVTYSPWDDLGFQLCSPDGSKTEFVSAKKLVCFNGKVHGIQL